jgi:microcystin-dependent protein
MFGGNFAPAGWMFCDGSQLAISENEALFQLIGTTYGGNGQTTFALPDLRGRVPVHQGTGNDGVSYQMGQAAGTESVTLAVAQVPPHSHVLTASSAGATAGTPVGNVTAAAASGTTTKMYAGAATSLTNMAAAAVSHVGDGFPHENRMPYLAISFIISLYGIFPSQS